MFSEKLNFLMDIIKIQNSALAAAANMDASHISRLRRGNRMPPKNQNYIMPMSRFFSRHLTGDFQKKIICDTLHINELPSDTEAVAGLIYSWLTKDDNESVPDAELFIKTFAAGKRHAQSFESNKINAPGISDSSCYFGNAGKREAVIRFLTAVINESTPQTLLLFSDEEMSWMTEDAAFGKRWAELLTDVLRRENRIKIVHTINRNADEMMEAVTKWVPVYVTGLIEPYYYPKLRDGVFQRTMFIAPKTAAVISSSVGHNNTEMLNLYIEQPGATAALATEFERYLSLCRPLMRIYGTVNAERYFEDFIDFSANEAPSVMLTPTPSLMTMPEEVARSISERHACPQLYELWRRSSALLDINLKCKITEIITAAPSDSDRVPLPMQDMFRSESLYYTKKEYALHIERILSLMKEQKNYTAVLSEHTATPVMIWGKEDVGTLIARTETPATVFAFSEQNMTAAFWTYLVKQCGSITEAVREQAICTLKALAQC